MPAARARAGSSSCLSGPRHGGAGSPRILQRDGNGHQERRRAAPRLPRRPTGGAAEPDRDRRPEVRDQRPALLPRAAPGRLDLRPEGAQLLHRRAQLAARASTGTARGSTRAHRCGSTRRRTTRPTPSTRACPSAWPRSIPDARLIYIVRDPIDRIAAHWVHNYSKGRHHGDLAETILKPKTSYIDRSRYAMQLERFLAVLSRASRSWCSRTRTSASAATRRCGPCSSSRAPTRTSRIAASRASATRPSARPG